ncbi:MAG: tRNA (adenosine(37)-N6)-threonylcarbamoyltransferase complex dimerization subunit type 1 TsaB [Myxococcota bacterium]
MLLALETASDGAGIALLDGEQLVGETGLPASTHLAGALLPALDELLSRCRAELGAVERIALSIGPGSFTGLRVGLATALGLCLGTERRIVPVPTLAALSLAAGEAERIVPMLDARRGQVYTGLYGPGADALRADRVCAAEAWLHELRGLGPVILLGPGAELHAARAREILGEDLRWPEGGPHRPRASWVGRLGARLASQGLALEPSRVELRYLRRSDAERRRRGAEAPRGSAGHPTRKPII